MDGLIAERFAGADRGEITMSKIAVIFPGIGYHADKPLLYYSARMAEREFGYQIVRVEYSTSPENIKGDSKKIRQAVELYVSDALRCLQQADVKEAETILFLSKSIGTIVAGACASELGIKTKNIYYTPLEETFSIITPGSGIAFHGTADPWAVTAEVRKCAEEMGIPLYITEEANHSLETGDALRDIRNLATVMEHSRAYMADNL